MDTSPACISAPRTLDWSTISNPKRAREDVGGEDRPISKEMLELCDYIVPNESELKRNGTKQNKLNRIKTNRSETKGIKLSRIRVSNFLLIAKRSSV